MTPSSQHIEAIDRSLAPTQRILFAALCVDRGVVCCEAFSHHSGRDLTAFHETRGGLRRCAVGGSPLEALSDYIEDCEAAIHTTEEYGSAVACQAQNAMLGLLYALDAGGVDFRVQATADCLIDAADAFLIGDPGPRVANETELSPLVVREIAWQVESARLIQSGADAVKLFAENWYYSIVPALGPSSD